MQIPFYWVYLVVLIGFLSGVMVSFSYVKGVRGDGKSYPWSELLISAWILGGPGVLLAYSMSKEIQLEDKNHKRAVLLCSILSFLIEIAIIVLLSYFKVISYTSTAS